MTKNLLRKHGHRLALALWAMALVVGGPMLPPPLTRHAPGED